MHLPALSSILALGMLVSAGMATMSKTIVHERRSDLLAEQWEKADRLDPAALLPVRIGLTQSNLLLGHEILMNISDPRSPSYGKHLSSEEVTELFAPSNESVLAVTKWLTSSGFHISRLAQSPNKQWIQFDATSSELGKLLHTQFHVWQHSITGDRDVASDEYSIPSELRHHIDYITPGIRLRPRTEHTTRRIVEDDTLSTEEVGTSSNSLKHCPERVTPGCIRAMYNITQGTTAHKGNMIGFYESAINFYQPDFDKFTENFYPRIPQGFAPKQYAIDGTSLAYRPNTRGDGEANLDVDVAMPIVYPQGFVIYQTPYKQPPSKYYEAEFDTWLDAIDGSFCNYTAYGITGDDPRIDPTYPDRVWPHQLQCGTAQRTNVISISYGTHEAYYPTAYLKRQCNEYMKLGMQGVSLFFASGDYGTTALIDRFGQTCLGPKEDVFAPLFPASCPYVTTVGGTVYHKGANILDHTQEQAAHFSSGGFSNVFNMPEYQKKAVENYLTRHPPAHKSYSAVNDKGVGKNGGIFNRNGRAFPDVSAIAVNVMLVANSTIQRGEGTSAATPLWAAIFSRINEERLAMNKSTVGFVNPALLTIPQYMKPKLMHDITTGNNFGCMKSEIGFNATKGWDAVTGLGSPSFSKLMEYFVALG